MPDKRNRSRSSLDPSRIGGPRERYRRYCQRQHRFFWLLCRAESVHRRSRCLDGPFVGEATGREDFQLARGSLCPHDSGWIHCPYTPRRAAQGCETGSVQRETVPCGARPSFRSRSVVCNRDAESWVLQGLDRYRLLPIATLHRATAGGLGEAGLARPTHLHLAQWLGGLPRLSAAAAKPRTEPVEYRMV